MNVLQNVLVIDLNVVVLYGRSYKYRFAVLNFSDMRVISNSPTVWVFGIIDS